MLNFQCKRKFFAIILSQLTFGFRQFDCNTALTDFDSFDPFVCGKCKSFSRQLFFKIIYIYDLKNGSKNTLEKNFVDFSFLSITFAQQYTFACN